MSTMLYKDPSQPVARRVEDLMSRMTLEEKVAQLCGNLPGAVFKDGKIQSETLKELFPNGHGRITQYSMTGLCDPIQIAEASNALQKYFVEETRLGIPVALQSENLCGYPGAQGTLFPAQINVGSTWEPELAREMAKVIGQESRAVGINSAMSPVIDVSREPRWGRTYETYGEDPYLTSQMGINYVAGMQDDQKGVACIAKHFLGYATTQGGLNCSVANISDRELYEVYATPFEACDKESHLSAMMANYGPIDGICVGANKKVARTLLRDTMGFDGVLTSDGAAIMKMFNFFHLTESYKEAGLLAIKGGLETEIPVGGAFAQLPDYVRSGELDESVIDTAVRRVLTVKFEYGLFEHPYVDVEAVKTAMTNAEKAALSEKLASDSLILLKNNGVLPLKKGQKLAVIGPHADNLRYPISGYTYPAYIEMIKAGSEDDDTVTFNGIADENAAAKTAEKKPQKNMFSAMLDTYSESDRAKLNDLRTLLTNMGSRSLKDCLADEFEVTYAQGCDIVDMDTSRIPAAVKAAEEADVVVLAMGGNCGWVNVTGGEGKDRSTIALPGVQQQLLEAVCATGKPVVVILYGPGVFGVTYADEHAAAIIQAWMPGAQAGKVVTEVLDGTVNPGGHLTFTVPRHIGQNPLFYNHHVGSGYCTGGDTGFAASIFSGGYVDGSDKPLYAFGHGLSYTSFAVSDCKLDSDTVGTDGTINASCVVTNTGDRAGDEVVQLYYHFKSAHVTRPNKTLVGFKRVHLEAGQSARVDFALSCAQLAYYNEEMDYVVEPGKAEVMIGTASDKLDAILNLTLTGKPVNYMGRRAYTCPVTVTGL